MADTLFDKGDPELPQPETPHAGVGGKPRLRKPFRQQKEMHYATLDEMLDSEHPVRAVWELVQSLDLSAWLRDVKAVEGVCGRNGTDPRLLLALWVYATVQGVASARELARQCEHHTPYQWLCGGVTVNYHMLADFRSQGDSKLDELLTQVVAGLLDQKLVTLHRVAQDGMRVRASAGRSSFRSRRRLEECRTEARQQVEVLKQLADADPQELSARQKAARERAERERQSRVRKAMEACEDVEQKRHESRSRHKSKPALGSTTDPDARVMKMADGGYRPAYNVQFATDVASGIIVGVDVVNAGSDNGQMAPMVDQVRKRYGVSPQNFLVDGGFASLPDIEHVETDHRCAVYMPIKDEVKKLAAGEDPYARGRSDTDAVAGWRTRMQSAAAKAIYKLRAQSAEWVNAICRNRNLQRMPVRGLKRTRAIGLLHALTHNLLRSQRLAVKPG